MLRNHGVLVTGTSVAQAFERLYFLERACQAQLLAMSSGRRIAVLPESVQRATAEQFSAEASVAGHSRSDLHFSALKRLLDRDEADYAS
jgi:ribulose-5-phosphate 4-epimerase/fuculose-1-phosphate aldolase